MKTHWWVPGTERLLALPAIMLAVNLASAGEVYQADCRSALGMQSGGIPDSAITASSSYDEPSVGPRNARIRTERNGGAWCPKKQIAKNVYEWLQIDLGELKMVTLVETQGRFGNGQGQEFAEKYLLEYQREDRGRWIRFRNRKSQEIFDGNTNTYIAELREVHPPIIARRIRFVPYSSHPRTVCTRVEVYGCTWKDGVVAYNMRQGDRRGSEVDLYDFTYDGKVENNYLSGGLGQLVDSQIGQSNFRLASQGLAIKGYEWVGWKNDSVHTPPVEIIFRFDTVRNFTAVWFYCNNLFSKDVRVFRMAKLYFSIGGKHYMSEPVVYPFMRDIVMEFPRHVVISKIPHKIGKYIKILLYFDARWIMISEVKFESEKAVGNFSEEVVPLTPVATTVLPPTYAVEPKVPRVVLEVVPKANSSKNPEDPSPGSPAVEPGPTPNTVINSSKEKKSLDDEAIGIIIGALAALILLLFVVVLIIILRHRRRKYSNGHQMQPIEPKHVTLNLNDLRPSVNGKVSKGNMYNSIATSDVDSDKEGSLPVNGKVNNGEVYREPYDSIQSRKLPELPKTPESSVFKPNIYNPEPPPVPPPPSVPYASNDLVTMVPNNIQGVSGNVLYAAPSADMMWKEDLSVMEFPRENLQFIEKLGEGQFGEVHLCEALRMMDLLGDDFLVNRTGSRSMLVAVKTLRRNADEQARSDFHKEVKIMARLKDPNIVRVLGVCTRDDPLCVIVEYMKFGDLNQFLRQHVPENTLAKKKRAKTLSYGCLVYMATQVASGMKYLEALNMVHRDLATRNCLVGPQYTIKISDFGMSRSLYSADYYRIEGRAVLPIRWMAWESVLLGKFSSKTDVWSFGVTIWEILTYAREQPFDNMTDEQVIENCGHFYRSDSQEIYLPHPEPDCPREIYDLMRECWNRDEKNRPAFREIHMFLQRKNMGYNPKDEKYGNKIAVPVV